MISTTTNAAYQLLHEGILEFSRMEEVGFGVDPVYVQRAIDRTARKITKLEDRIQQDGLWKDWQQEYGLAAKLSNRKQLAHVLYDVRGHKPTHNTAGERWRPGDTPKLDDQALQRIELPILETYRLVERLRKARNTFLMGIQRETEGTRVHQFLNLHSVLSFRSSSDGPDLQNMPVRDPLIAKLVRQAFVPQKGYQYIEIDFAGNEVRGAACYNKDPVLIDYLLNPDKDMHRDMAAQLCCLDAAELRTWPKEYLKPVRHCGKNKFVFPEFYGDYYCNTAEGFWEELIRTNAKLPDGTTVIDHLRSQGIKRLGACDPDQKPRPGTFERHVQKVEEDFWNRRFQISTEWKRRWYKRYLETGGFATLTGFYIHGFFRRNQVINWPVQGSAFHWLLWALIRVAKEMRRRKMRSRLVNQIHDSMIGEVHKRERDDYIELAVRIITEELRKAFPWMVVPMEMEVEVCPVGESWHAKQKIDGNWTRS